MELLYTYKEGKAVKMIHLYNQHTHIESMKTTLEQKNKCMNCDEELHSYDAFYCWSCRDKVKFTIEEGIDLELVECQDCGIDIARQNENYYSDDKDHYVSNRYRCFECAKKKPILIDFDSESVYYYELFECELCGHESSFGDSYNADYDLVCFKCQEKKRKIDAEKRRQEQIKRLKFNAEKRKSDVFPNIFANIIAEVKQDHYYDRKQEEYLFRIKKQKDYVFRCGYHLPIEDYYLESAIQYHVYEKNCMTCKILAGKSKANILTQDHVMELFKKGIFGKSTKQFDSWGYGSSKDSNYKSVEKFGNAGQLIHYNTTEAIRTNDGTVIANFQCWSAGFAKCSISGADYSLPLTTLEGVYSDDDLLLNLKVLDDNENLSATLFRVKDDYLVFGRDLIDNSLYMVKIPKEARTVSEALETLKPELAKNGDFQRQGDIFFVPINTEGLLFKPSLEDLENTDSHTASWYELERNLDEGLVNFAIEKLGINVESDDTWTRREKLQDFLSQRKLSPKEIYDIELAYTKANKRKALRKEKRNNIILGTNHIAEKLKTIYGITYVKGVITHGRQQHTKFILDDWHIALKNLAVTSWQITVGRHGGGGFD